MIKPTTTLPQPVAPPDRPEKLTDWDHETYLHLVSHELTPAQVERIVEPPKTYPRQEDVLAIHWHPEFVPMDHIRTRIDRMFPNGRNRLIIPTQHNVMTEFDGYTGVEVDCYSHEFRLKVQLLVHFETPRVAGADVFESMLNYTFKYRSHQLFEFINTIIEPAYESRLSEAVRKTAADQEIIDFVRVHTKKLYQLFLEHESATPAEAIRNKLLAHYLRAQKMKHDAELVSTAEVFLRAIKKVVKSHFNPEYFYATQEVIEEVRGLGGGIIIPHPEQFWPILLADYDVDGYEVWNPQSREYTEFLVNVVSRQNKSRQKRRPLLITMGDDCHMGEKVKEPDLQDAEKASREIGVQPLWDDLVTRKGLLIAGADRSATIEAYKERLAS